MPDLRADIRSALDAFTKVEGAARPLSPTNQEQAAPATVEGASRPLSSPNQGQAGPATFRQASLHLLRKRQGSNVENEH